MNILARTNYLVNRARHILTEKGLWELIQSIMRKAKTTAFETNSAPWFRKDLLERTEILEPKIPAQVDFFSTDETINWLKRNHHRFPWMYIDREIEVAGSEKHFFSNVRHGGEIIGYAKVAKRRCYVLDYDGVINIPPKVAFVYDAFILPEYRGNGLAPFLFTSVAKFLSEQQYSALWCHIPEWNTASIKFVSKCGFKRIRRVRYRRFFRFKFFSFDPEKLMRGFCR